MLALQALLASNATSAFVATQVATGMAAVTWALISWAHTGRPSTVGSRIGAVAGLVAITPASGFVSPMVCDDYWYCGFSRLLCRSYVQK